MSIRQRRIAQVSGIVTLVFSLSAATAMVSTGSRQLPIASKSQPDAHVFVPTGVALPIHDEEPAPTF